MNIIILTGRFGMGHIKAAEAIKEEIMAHGNNYAKIIDCMDYLFPTVSGGIYKGFDFMVSRCSGIYNALNKLSSKSSSVPLTASVIKKIDRLLDEYQADAVVVTFPVCSQYISAYKRMKQSDIPLYTYVTDVSVHEEWIAPGTDKYFVGDKTTKQTLVSKGVEEEKIVISGIPVRKCFYEKTLQNRSSQKKKF